ncbi:MAG: MFS transporter [Prochloraceae cyanobacterium]|nr:MFS transporter [Prochloraceae cyanobacterium]
MVLFAQLPSILFSPLTGALVDRWNRRTAMLVSDCGAGISTLAIALLLFSGNIQIWHLYPIIAIGSIFNAFQLPAYQATLALLVPKQHLVRVNIIVTLGLASSQLIAPFLGCILLITLGIKGVFLIDFLTFSVL